MERTKYMSTYSFTSQWTDESPCSFSAQPRFRSQSCWTPCWSICLRGPNLGSHSAIVSFVFLLDNGAVFGIGWVVGTGYFQDADVVCSDSRTFLYPTFAFMDLANCLLLLETTDNICYIDTIRDLEKVSL